MPPKKKDPNEKEDPLIVSANFRVKLLVESEPPEDIGILLEWIEGEKTKAIDCGEIRDLEGFNDVLPVTQEAELDPKKDKKVDKNKKKDAVVYEPGKKYKGFFEYAEDDVKIDEVFAKNICRKMLRCQIVNTDEMKVLHEVKIDYSSMILYKTTEAGKFGIAFEQNLYFNKQTLPWLSSLAVRVETNKTLLKPEYKHYLNPIQINLTDIENLYIDASRKTPLQPLTLKYDFLRDGKSVLTERVETSEHVELSAKHVFLMGLEKQIDLKEHLESHRIEVEIHDRDEVKQDNIRKSVEYIELKEPEPVEEEDNDPKKKKKAGTGAAAKKPEPPKKKEEQKKDAKKKKDKKKDYVFEDFQQLPPVELYQREFGVAQFYLRGLLNPYSLHYDLQAPIYPRRVFVDEDRGNLELNKTARKKGRDIIKATDYFTKNSLLKMELHLSFPLDRFKQPDPPKVEEPVDPKKSGAAAKKDDPKKAPGKAKEEEEPPKPVELTEHQLLLKTQKLKNVSPVPVFERAIYLFEYKNRDFLKVLQKALVDINLEGLKIANGTERDIRTRKLTPQEKVDNNLDYISGVEFMDKQFRMFIVEGLRAKGMAKLQELIQKTAANTELFKIMKDPTITFDHRLYADFDIDIKKVKLRTNLKSLVAQPQMYLREKIPQETYDTIMRLKRMREKNTIYEVISSDLWLTAPAIISFERNYGEALNDDDLYGIPIKKKIRKRGQKAQPLKDDQKSDFASEVTSVISMDDLRESQRKEKESVVHKSIREGVSSADQPDLKNSSHVSPENKSNLIQSNLSERRKPKMSVKFDEKVKSLAKTSPSLPGSPNPQHGEVEKSDNDSMLVEAVPGQAKTKGMKFGTMRKSSHECMKDKYDLYDLRLLKADKDEKKRLEKALANPLPKNTVYTTQMEQLRDQARNDPDHFYTYSEKYMSLSVDPYKESERLKEEEMIRRSKFITKDGFKCIVKREPGHYNKHYKQMTPEEIEVMKKYPYHEEQARMKNMLNPKEPNSKNQFKKYLPKLKNGIFNKIETSEEEKLTAVEVQKRASEAKLKAKDEFKKKMVVDDPTFHVGLKPIGIHQFDRHKGLMDQEPIKKSLRLPAKYITNKVVKRDEYLQNLPISFNLSEEKHSKADIEKLIQLDRKFNPKTSSHDQDFERIRQGNQRDFVFKPSRYDAFTDKYT